MASVSTRVEAALAQGSGIRRPTTFLSLAPTLGASYPPKADNKVAASSSFSAALARKEAFTAPPMSRSSSYSSSASSSSAGSRQLRFLKLGPVYNGEDDGTCDWSEVYDEELIN